MWPMNPSLLFLLQGPRTDLSIDPKGSDFTVAAVDNGLIMDLPNDWFSDCMAPPTYCLTGVTADMQGNGVTRIDTVFANPIAAHLCQKLYYDYEATKGYDHVAIVPAVQR